MKRPPPHTRGGKREGAGRKPDWLREKCARLVEEKKIVDFVANVASGQYKQKVLVKQGPQNSFLAEVPCDVKDRLKAAEMLWDRGFGKPPQDVQLGLPAAGASYTIKVEAA